MSFSHSACGPSSPDACAAGDEGAEDADISSLLGMLASVTDPRSPQGIQHILEFVLAVCLVAMLAGAKNYHEIAGHAADIPQPLLRKLGAEWSWFRLRYKYPSESTIRNVLTRIDAAELDMITCAWLFARARKSGNGEWEIALDGKVMRGAWTDENDKVTLFSAMLHREAVTIAQVRVPDGTNEITQADAILDTVEGCVFLRGVSFPGVPVMRRSRGPRCWRGRSGPGGARRGSVLCSTSCSRRGRR